MKNKTKELITNLREAQVQLHSHIKVELKKKKTNLGKIIDKYGLTTAEAYGWQRDYIKCLSAIEKAINSPFTKVKSKTKAKTK